jgi:effector-binding domain-containing protein
MIEIRRTVVLCLVITALALSVVAGDEPEPPAKVHLKHTEPHSVATMMHKGPYAEVPEVIIELLSAMGDGGYHQAGPYMVVYYNDPRQTPEEELLWEVRIPVAYPGPIAAAERDAMGFKYLDPMFVAYTYHIGAYDEVGAAYMELMEWMGRNEYQIIGPPVEVYWSDPEKVPAEQCVTEIQFPVLEKKIPGGTME